MVDFAQRRLTSDLAGGTQTTNARDLHEKLRAVEPFDIWIKSLVSHLKLVEHRDYTIDTDNGSSEYFLTREAAQTISMTSSGERADAYRKHLLGCEKTLQENEARRLADEPYIQRGLDHLNNSIDKLNATNALLSQMMAGLPATAFRSACDAIWIARNAQVRPEAALFPLMEGGVFEALVADIRANGLRNPVLLHQDGSIIDGRNRFAACARLLHRPEFAEWTGTAGQELAFVLSTNLHRRHLDESQRAMVASRIATMRHGGNRRSDQGADLPFATTTADAARILNVGERTVKAAKSVRENGSPAVVSMVERGKLSVSAAAEVASLLPKDEQVAVEAKARAAVLPEPDELPASTVERQDKAAVAALKQAVKTSKLPGAAAKEAKRQPVEPMAEKASSDNGAFPEMMGGILALCSRATKRGHRELVDGFLSHPEAGRTENIDAVRSAHRLLEDIVMGMESWKTTPPPTKQNGDPIGSAAECGTQV